MEICNKVSNTISTIVNSNFHFTRARMFFYVPFDSVYGRDSKISIPGWTIVDSVFGIDRHVSYQIVYRYWKDGKINKIITNKRYTDFYRFHQKLIRKYGEKVIQNFPPKQKKGRFDPFFIECRHEQLELYLSRIAVTNPDEFINFLGIYKAKYTRVKTDGGPHQIDINKNLIDSCSPARSCLATNTTVCQKKQVKFKNDVINNEKASKNPTNKEHLSRYATTLYNM
ncbi:hypothetical protein Glove_682g26 [Diversispora epigaea]|uniref:PX domain-containing protein n=1 Tax=Diversispora epigaea TaxID=1348612 RepID=A0A397G8N4_9GLOM|nr:hypothetical protein Glove_682g26 [Diversispora epigaea]